MSDLISKRDAIKAVHSYWKKRIDETPTVKKSGVDVYSQEAIDMLLHSKNLSTLINMLPTIDAVPVVRCKDCKYNPKAARRYDDDDPIYCFDWCWYMEGKDGYCCEGKRNDG